MWGACRPRLSETGWWGGSEACLQLHLGFDWCWVQIFINEGFEKSQNFISLKLIAPSASPWLRFAYIVPSQQSKHLIILPLTVDLRSLVLQAAGFHYTKAYKLYIETHTHSGCSSWLCHSINSTTVPLGLYSPTQRSLVSIYAIDIVIPCNLHVNVLCSHTLRAEWSPSLRISHSSFTCLK